MHATSSFKQLYNRSDFLTPVSLVSLLFLSACQHVNVAQMAYEALRTEDCRRNQLDDFCARTYAYEYHEYIRLRNEFLRDQQRFKREYASDKVVLTH